MGWMGDANLNATRRSFLKISGIGAITALVGPQLLALGNKVWAEAAKVVDRVVDMTKKKDKSKENEQAVTILTNMNYVEDAEKAEKNKKLTRVDKTLADGKVFPAKKQFCHNCNFFQGEIDGKLPGKCVLVPVPGILVHNKGYCQTYTVHPKAKV
ncbi:MAG: high-potential iron-sulfur protein [Bdellovibrionales bacterium]|nr:high-potential iron-sulfur protein [Bdellovibrionales bacterium]